MTRNDRSRSSPLVVTLARFLVAAVVGGLGVLLPVPALSQPWQVQSASICNSSHDYVFSKAYVWDYPWTGPPDSTAKVDAQYLPAAGKAVEKAIWKTPKGKFEAIVTRYCNSDPWLPGTAGCSAPTVQQDCDFPNCGPTEFKNGIVPPGVVKIQPSPAPVPKILLPEASRTYKVAEIPFKVQLPVPWPSPFCAKARLVVLVEQGESASNWVGEASAAQGTFAGVWTWPPAPGPGWPQGAYHALAYMTEEETGATSAANAIVGTKTTTPFYIGHAWPGPDVTVVGKSMLEIVSPKGPMLPLGGTVQVRVKKELYHAATSHVALTWKAPEVWFPTGPPLPTALGFKKLSKAGSEPLNWTEVSAPLNFQGKPGGNWKLTACVRAEDNDICQESAFSVAAAKILPPPGGGLPAGGAGSQAAQSPPLPGPPWGRGSTGPSIGTPPGTLAGPSGAGTPPPGIAAPPGPVASLPPPGISGGPAGGLRLTAARQQGPADLLLAFQNAGGDSPSQAVELRLGGRAIGHGRLPGLAAQQQAQVVVHFELPAGARGPVDLEVWVGSGRVGSARVTPVVRAR